MKEEHLCLSYISEKAILWPMMKLSSVVCVCAGWLFWEVTPVYSYSPWNLKPMENENERRGKWRGWPRRREEEWYVSQRGSMKKALEEKRSMWEISFYMENWNSSVWRRKAHLFYGRGSTVWRLLQVFPLFSFLTHSSLIVFYDCLSFTSPQEERLGGGLCWRCFYPFPLFSFIVGNAESVTQSTEAAHLLNLPHACSVEAACILLKEETTKEREEEKSWNERKLYLVWNTWREMSKKRMKRKPIRRKYICLWKWNEMWRKPLKEKKKRKWEKRKREREEEREEKKKNTSICVQWREEEALVREIIEELFVSTPLIQKAEAYKLNEERPSEQARRAFVWLPEGWLW